MWSLEPPSQPLKRLPAPEDEDSFTRAADVVGSGLLWPLGCSSGPMLKARLKENWGLAATFEAPRASAISTPRERYILNLVLNSRRSDLFKVLNL